MFNFFKKPPKVEFFNVNPGVAQFMPLIPAKDLKRNWVENARRDFSEVRKNPDWKNHELSHTARCPGIFSLLRHGWVLRTWFDVVVETNGDGRTFKWRAPANPSKDVPFDWHGEQQLFDYFSQWPSNTLTSVLKFMTGWRCNVPHGYYLMEIPIPYNEETRFTTLPGFFYRESGIAHMNTQILWHVMNGNTLIKAGTPISQLILLPKETHDFVCRDEKKEDRMVIDTLYKSSKFVYNYGELKKLFGGRNESL